MAHSREDPEGEGGGEGACAPLSAAFLWLVAARGGESDKDRRTDDKSFMVLRPHVDGGQGRTMI